MRFLISLIISTLFISCVAKTPDQQTKRGYDLNNIPQLPFDFKIANQPSKNDETQQSKLSQKQTDTSSYQKQFSKIKDPYKAYDLFESLFEEARKKDSLPNLFLRFSTSDVIRRLYRTDTTKISFRKELSKRWVKRAVAEKDETIKTLYSNYHHIFNYNRRYSLNLRQNSIRPGKEITLYGYQYRRMQDDIVGTEMMKVELSKLELDSTLKPVGFKTIKTDSSTFKNYRNRFSTKVEEAGVYKLTVYSETIFRQFYFQASWLDGVVKFDKNRVVVIGSSFKDTLPGPYRVHYVAPDGEIYTTITDSAGISIVGHPLGDDVEKLKSKFDLKIVLQKGDQLAFLQGYLRNTKEDLKALTYIYTDRPVYRPGSTVQIRGILKLLIDNRDLNRADVDSVKIRIYDPRRSEVYKKFLSIDKWGHFGDSLSLSKTSKQGRYMISVEGIKNDSGKSHPNYRVERYRNSSFIVEAYKKPEFEITAKATRETFSTEDSVTVDVHGEYYFGGALAKTPVTVRWYRQQMYHHFGYWKGSRHISFYPSGGKVFLSEEKATLDVNGNLALSYKPEMHHEQIYLTAEVIATDKSRRQIRAEADVKVVKSNGYISFNLDKWEYEIGETAKIEVLAVDLDGNRLKAPVNLRIKKDRQIILDSSFSTNSEGSLFYNYPIKEEGRYTLEAVTKDGSGKTIYQEQELRAVKKKRWNWNWERVEVTLDKEQYNYGDTAIISVKTGADSTLAFCAIEGNEMLELDVREINDHRFSYKLPITKALGLNIQFYTGFSGESRFASRNHRITVVDTSALLNVEVKGEKNLKPGETFKGTLKITDTSGKPVRSNFSVALVDEAIFAVANEFSKNNGYGYYRGSQKNPLDGILTMFPRYFQTKVNTQYNRFDPKFLATVGEIAKEGRAFSFDDSEVMGYLDSPSPRMALGSSASMKMSQDVSSTDSEMLKLKEQLTKLENSSGGGTLNLKKKGVMKAKEQATPPRERSNFKDLGYWNASITTNENGEAKLNFPMPDDLTQWRLVIVGSDGDALLIDFTDSLITKQNIMVKLQAPRSVVEEDSLVVTSVVHNYSDTSIEAEVTLKLKDDTGVATILSDITQLIKLKKGETGSIDWKVVINKKGKFTCYSSVTSSQGGDAESRSYPILINGIARTKSFVGILGKDDKSIDLSLALPADGLKGSREVTISYSPSLVYSLFESLEYLTGYPYGCVEQTMSRFLPNLYVAKVMKRLNLPADSLFEKLPDYTKKGIERLEQLQNDRGGWGWWRSNNSDARMTALVVHGLSYALTTELNDENRRDINALLKTGRIAAERLLSKKSIALERKIDLAYALKWSNKNRLKDDVKKFCEKRGKLNSASLAKLLELTHILKMQKESNLILSLLESKVNSSSSSAYWEGSREYRWYSQKEEVTAQVVRALMTVDPENKHLDKAVIWMSRQKRDGYWRSTKTTAKVIEALSLYLEQSKEFEPAYTSTIKLNGKNILNKKVTKGDIIGGSGEILLSEKQLGSGKVNVSLEGAGRLYYSVNMKYVADEKPIKKADNGVNLSRSFKKIVYHKDKSDEWIVERVPFRGTCKSGDEIEVSVTVESGRHLEHLMVEDFFASGMEVLNKPQTWYNRWCGWWWQGYTHKEARDDRMVFFMTDKAPGKTTFTYLLRAETPGTFTALPVRAECMYEPEVNGNSKSFVVEIKE